MKYGLRFFETLSNLCLKKPKEAMFKNQKRPFLKPKEAMLKKFNDSREFSKNLNLNPLTFEIRREVV